MKADKGNSVVIIDKDDYDSRVQNMLNQGPYIHLSANSRPQVEKKLENILKRLVEEEKITKQQEQYLKTFKTAEPMFYALPKLQAQHWDQLWISDILHFIKFQNPCPNT